jgi:hypothetical protein
MSPFALFSLRRTVSITATLFLLAIPGLSDDAGQALVAATPAGRTHAALAHLPLSFEPNLGQVDPRVKFLSRGRGYTLFLTKDQAILRIERRMAKNENALVRLRLVGAKPDAEVTGRGELPGEANYFLGNDPKKWHTNVPTYAKVRYHDVYPGVDLEYYGSPSAQGQLEYDFIVAPGADPSAIALQVGAAREPRLRIDTGGDLMIPAHRGEIRFHKPLIYQRDAGSSLVADRRSLVEGRYILDARNRIRFLLGPYDHSKPLVIDPVLSYSTYLGGSDMDYAYGIAVDASGSAYVTGYTASVDFPVVSAAQSSPGGGSCSEDGAATPCFDAFVSKLNSTGTALVYSTYLGGSDEDQGAAIAVDSSGHAYVAGYTYSTNFPVQNALQPNNAGGVDAFVTELSPNGASLVYSTYWGGSLDDVGTGIAVDSNGNAYLSGYTESTNYRVTSGALQTTYGNGAHNGFVVKFESGGTQVGYSTYLGGSGDDYIYAAAVDSAGDAYVTGSTNSTNFPTLNAFQPKLAGGQCGGNTFTCYDAFAAKLNPAGSALIFSTYLGGTGSDYGYAIALDRSANAYLTGYTTSTNFPTTSGAFERTFAGGYDVFVTKLNSSGSTLGYSTYLGGSGTQVAYGIAVDSNGSAYATGYNYGGGFPTANPVQAHNAGIYDAFVSVLNPAGSSLLFSTYLGGSQDDFGRGIALDSSGNVYVTGATFSTDFPTTSGAFEPSYMGGPYDAFVTMYNAPAIPLVAISPSSYNFGNQALGTASSPQAIDLTNNGGAVLTISNITASGDFSQTNNCGSSLALGASCSISATFTPTATGLRAGSITVADNASPPTQTISLSGTGTGVLANLTPGSLTFSSQPVGASSSTQNLTLSNTSSATLTISSIAVSGDFSETNTCGTSLAANTSCSISVTFTPTATGSRSGSLTVTDNAKPTTQSASLSGTGTAAAANLAPNSVTFSGQLVGISSSPQTVTLANPGGATLTISSITPSGDFTETDNCGTSLAANTSCTISVTFTPTAIGPRTGSLTVTDNANPATQSTSLSGRGTAWGTNLSPTSLTFSGQMLGTSSSPQSVTLSNPANATLAISSITANGDFSETNTCGTSLAANASCAISVTFTPTATGSRTGSLTVSDNANPATQSASLAGTGTAPGTNLSPTSLTFSGQMLGTSSSPQNVTLSNPGTATLTISSITANGDFSETNTCGTSLPANWTCTIIVTFIPTATGSRAGSITVTDNANPTTQSASLSGTGTAATISLSPMSLTFAPQALGTSSSPQSVTLSNSGSASLAISSITVSGDFSGTNTCGTGLAASASCAISVTFTPTATGSRTGSITVTDNANPTTQSASLSGTGAAPAANLSPTSLTFSGQALGTSSSPQSVTLSNPGSAALAISSITVSGDFSGTNTCGTGLAASASCTISVTFTPTATGSRTGSITVTDNASPTTQSASLSGTGTAPAANLSPTSLTFSGQASGTSSGPQSVTLSNPGSATLAISSITVSGDFSETNTCGTSLAASASCTISVTFTPTATGSRTGSVTVTDNANPATQSASLSGTGTASAANLSPTSLTFSGQVLGTSSSPQSVTLSNPGSATLTISSIAASGDFSQTNTCGTSLAANSSCTISVTFAPTATGSRSGSVTVTDNANPTTQSASLSGTGTASAASLSPTSLTFSSQALSTSSSPQSVTLSNPGGAALTISSITVSGNFSETNTCGSSLAANSSCTISVTFTPTALGSRTGSLTVNDNANPATQSASLSGTGTAPAASLSPTSLTFSSQALSTSSSSQSVTLSNPGSATLAISSITVSGDFSETNTCGSGLAANSSCTISVTFAPTATGSRTGSLTVADNANPSTQTVSLSGTGTAPVASLSPASLTFSAQSLNTSGSSQNLILSNTGTATLNITSMAITGDFSLTNSCGSGVAAGASCSIAVTFKPTGTGLRTGTVTVTDNAIPSTQIANLAGTGAGPGATLSPSSLMFAAEPVGTTSSPQSVTLKNTGTVTLTISSVAASGDFPQTHTCGALLAVGASCTISVTFKPTASGTRTGTLSVSDNAVPSTQTVSLTGGGSPVASLSPTSLTFAPQAVGNSSSSQSVTLTNTGGATLAITGVSISGDFSQTNTCGSSVAVGASCDISVTFEPTASGTRTGTLTITDNANPTTQAVSLTGMGTGGPAVSLSPASLTFASEAVGTGSTPQSFTLTNTGTSTLTMTSVAISGDFSQTNTCGSSVGAGGSCSVSVTFKPSASGSRTGAVTITDNASPATQTVSLTGTGAGGSAVSLSPTSLTFASQPVGTSSTPQSFTLTNTGTSTLTMTSIAISGDFSQTNTCGSSLGAGGSCSVSVTFKPSASGSRTGAVTITDNASPATQTVSLTGTGAGATVTLTPFSLTFPSQMLMTISTAQTVSLTNAGSELLTISGIKISGGFSQTNTCGASVAAGASCSIAVMFMPLSAGALTGTLTVTDSANPTIQTVSLSGTGASTIAKLSPPSLTFANQTVGTTSNAQSVTLTNTGGASLSIISVAVSGDASQNNNCGSSVAVKASCTFSITFNPTNGGSRTGAIAVIDTAEGSPQTITLSGTGEDFTIAAAAGSSTSATVLPGGTATYSLSAQAVGGFNQQVAFACSGAPAGASCTVSPASTNISSTANLKVSLIMAAASGLPRHNPLPRLPEPKPWLLWTMAFLAFGSLVHAVRSRETNAIRRRMAMAAFGALVLAMLALAACGGGGGAASPQPANSGAAAGTYSLAVTGTCTSCSTTLSHSITLTLTVQ